MIELIRQNYIDKIFLTENLGHVKILTGLRYSGKSTILKQAYEYKKQKVPKEHIKFIDFKKIGYDKEKNKQILIKILKHITDNYEDNKYVSWITLNTWKSGVA